MEVRNRFKGLEVIDRVPDELWNKVCDIVQETGIKTISIEKKCKKKKMKSDRETQISHHLYVESIVKVQMNLFTKQK